MAPVLDEIAATYKDKVILLKVDVEENKAVANALQIENMPTLLLYKNGSIVWNAEGLTLKDAIVDAINKN
jgi:thioredoxin 1